MPLRLGLTHSRAALLATALALWFYSIPWIPELESRRGAHVAEAARLAAAEGQNDALLHRSEHTESRESKHTTEGHAAAYTEPTNPTQRGEGRGGLCSFAVGTVIQAENHVLLEWMEHYFAEGACHIYFLSNDDHGSFHKEQFLRIIAPYLARGLVSHFHVGWKPTNLTMLSKLKEKNPKMRVQKSWMFDLKIQVRRMSATVIPLAQKVARWLLILDMDEFMYGVGGRSMGEVLDGMPDAVNEICVPMSLFGTSGVRRQPACIVPHFVRRDRFNASALSFGKCVSRLRDTDRVQIHLHSLRDGVSIVWPPGLERYFVGLQGGKVRTAVWQAGEEAMQEWPLHMNHYRAQSEESYYRKRAPKNVDGEQVVRTQDLVDPLRPGDVVDDALRAKGHWRRLGKRCESEGGVPEWEEERGWLA